MKTTYNERDYTFGQVMLTLRNKIGLTQKQLGDFVGVSGRAVSEWETGNSYPKAERLKVFIALAVKSLAFPAGHEAEEIRALWKAARQRELLDEHWLSTLLSELPSLPPHAASEEAMTVGTVPCACPPVMACPAPGSGEQRGNEHTEVFHVDDLESLRIPVRDPSAPSVETGQEPRKNTIGKGLAPGVEASPLPTAPVRPKPTRAFSLFMGGSLGLILLLVVLVITLGPIIPVQRGTSPPPIHPDQIGEKWTFRTGGKVRSSPTVQSGVVYVGSDDHKVYAINASTGHQIWHFWTGNSIRSSPTVVNGVVYIGSYDDTVYAIDASTGRQIWHLTVGNLVDSSPTIVNGVLYVGSDDDNVYAINASTGQKIWYFSTGNLVYSSPTVVNGVLYIGSDDHKVYAINASTGHEIWDFSTGDLVYCSPTVVNGVLYIGSDDHKVYAINASTGHEIWDFSTADRVSSSPTVQSGVVYVGSNDGKVYAINADTGHQIWVFPTGKLVRSKPTVQSGVVYVGSYNGNVYAIDASTGHEIWDFSTGNSILSSPTVQSNVLYIGSNDSWVYALILPT